MAPSFSFVWFIQLRRRLASPYVQFLLRYTRSINEPDSDSCRHVLYITSGDCHPFICHFCKLSLARHRHWNTQSYFMTLLVLCLQHPNIPRRTSLCPNTRCCIFHLPSPLRPITGYARFVVIWVCILMLYVAMGSILTARWINIMAIEAGNLCVMQGMKSISNDSSQNTKTNFQAYWNKPLISEQHSGPL